MYTDLSVLLTTDEQIERARAYLWERIVIDESGVPLWVGPMINNKPMFVWSDTDGTERIVSARRVFYYLETDVRLAPRPYRLIPGYPKRALAPLALTSSDVAINQIIQHSEQPGTDI